MKREPNNQNVLTKARNWGGKRPGAGRKPGAINRNKQDLRLMARQHTGLALSTLARLCRHAESEAVQCAAATELLNRGHGKPFQTMQLDVDANVDLDAKVDVHAEPVDDRTLAMAILAQLHAGAIEEWAFRRSGTGGQPVLDLRAVNWSDAESAN